MSGQGRVLVLNGSHAEIPLIVAAKDLGYEVITTGADARGLGHEYASRYVHADFSDQQAIAELAQAYQVQGIISSCNDFAALTAAAACQDLGLPGHDEPTVSLALHHKDKFRALMHDLNLATIEAMACDSTEQAHAAFSALGSPVIIKPVDLTGGKGMTVCRSHAEIETAFRRAQDRSRVTRAVVERFITGSHHGFTSFIIDQQVAWWFADDEQYFLNPYLVAGTSAPTSLSDEALDSLKQTVNALAKGLSLVDGLVHVQCVNTSEGPQVIEACRRCPGDLYPEFVRKATSWNYAQAVVQSELGMPISLPDASLSTRPTVRHCGMAMRNGTYRGMEVAEQVAPHVTERWPLMPVGGHISDHLTQKTEIILLEFPTVASAREHLARRDSEIYAVVEPEDGS